MIELWNGVAWEPTVMYKGCFRHALYQSRKWTCSRVRRVKNQGEKDHYISLQVIGSNVEPFEWVV